MSQADALYHSRRLLKIIMPMLEAIVAKDNDAFATHKKDLIANIDNCRQQFAGLRDAYKITTQRRQHAQELFEAVHQDMGS